MSRPGGVEQGPPGVARVDGRVGLDHVADGDAPCPLDLPPDRADDAGRERVIEAEGVTDRDRLLPDLDVRLLRGDLDGDEQLLRGVDLEHGDVLARLDADHRGRERLRALEVHRERLGAVDDVKVRDDVPLVVPHEARAAARGDLDLRAAPPVVHHAGLCHEHDGGRDRLEHRDGVLLVLEPRVRRQGHDGRHRRERRRGRCLADLDGRVRRGVARLASAIGPRATAREER